MEIAERVQCIWCGEVQREDQAIFEDGYPYCDDDCLSDHTEMAEGLTTLDRWVHF